MAKPTSPKTRGWSVSTLYKHLDRYLSSSDLFAWSDFPRLHAQMQADIVKEVVGVDIDAEVIPMVAESDTGTDF